MMHFEEVLAKAYRLKGDQGEAQHFATREYSAHRDGSLMWNPQAGSFTDYLWREGRQSDVLSAATVFPLYFGVATSEQAHAMAAALRQRFLEPGGLGTTETENGQQWDRPNGWAPLQYLAIEGLEANGERDLARDIADRWLRMNVKGYANAGMLVEKYDVERGSLMGEAAVGAAANMNYRLDLAGPMACSQN